MSTCHSKVWKIPIREVLVYQHESLLFCDDFALIRDNTMY